MSPNARNPTKNFFPGIGPNTHRAATSTCVNRTKKTHATADEPVGPRSLKT
jgi:hypothetical protein